MRFLDKLVLNENFDKKIMINAIICSMLEAPSTSDYDEMDNVVTKSTILEPTIKHLMKETSLGIQAALNLVRRGKNKGA